MLNQIMLMILVSHCARIFLPLFVSYLLSAHTSKQIPTDLSTVTFHRDSNSDRHVVNQVTCPHG